MKILVTGANGYIGMGVVKKLLDDGIEVVATDFDLKYVDERAKRMKTDIFNIESPYVFFEKPDVLLHLAWRDGFKHNASSHIDDFAKHYHFIEKFIESGIGQICVLGSMHEVGFWEGSINEDCPTKPLSLYGVSKNALRQALAVKMADSKTVFQWIRGFYIVGNSERGCSIFSKITEAVKAGKKEFPFTKGTNQYDFIEYDSFCEQITSVVRQKEVVGIINCCSGVPMRLGERVEQFIDENEYNIKLQYGVFPDRAYDSKAVWGDNKKIRMILEKQRKSV